MKNKFEVIDGVAHIEIISKKYGKFTTTIDVEDLERLEEISRLCVAKGTRRYSNVFYVLYSETVDGKQTTRYLHRLLADAPADKVVDHLNQDTLDNRKYNLRTCDVQTNNHNIKPYTHRANNPVSSQHAGVYRNKQRKKWRAQITLNRKLIHLGYFEDEIDAAIAYAIAKNELHVPAVKIVNE